MNQLLFEGRSLVGIVSSIMRQDTMHIVHSRIEWDKMFRMADYHKVANIVYLSILGYRESMQDDTNSGERFFERYQESLLYGEGYRESVREVLTWLDMKGIPCTLLVSDSIRDYYTIPETADINSIQILLSPENFFLVKGYLVDLGYENDQIYQGFGERLRKISSVSVVLYHKLPFRTPAYEKGMRRLTENARLREPYTHIWMLPQESEFIYRMAAAAYHYVEDELTLREVLDLILLHMAWRDEPGMDKALLGKRLAEFGIDELAEKILRLGYMWFGNKKDNYYEHLPENMTPYDVLEERLLTRGMLNHESDEQALRLEKLLQKESEKDKKEEERRRFRERLRSSYDGIRKKMSWAFPDRHYMASIYPVVERLPVLLPVFWLARSVRLFFKRR